MNIDSKDFGISGYNETLKVLSENDILYFGDSNYLIKEINGIKIGFFALLDIYGQKYDKVGKAIDYLKNENVEFNGKNAVVIGRSNIVGKPMAMLLMGANGTVTIAHSRTANLKEVCKNADILVVAIGKAKFVTADMVKEGAVVIDVGMNRDENGKLCGDVDFENVKERTSYITPVPGGVGPMTITMLMYNTYITACKE